jgi:hypothetical protein
MPMQTWQKREILHPVTDGNLALASDSLGFIQTSKSKGQLSLVKNAIYDPQTEAFSEPNIIMTVIAMTVGLCLLWCLVVLTLYQIARFAL